MAVIAMGFLLDVLVTLFLLLELRLGMIVIHDLLKLRYVRRNSCQRMLVYGTRYKAVAWVASLQRLPCLLF